MRFHLKPLALFIASTFAACATHASNVLPAAPSVVGGSALIQQSGAQQTITQHSGRAVINWGSFSIGPQNSVVFNQPSTASVVLNRVTGADPSSLFGRLSANGQVFLVNPNGVFFGAGARLDTGGLVATTMSITNPDFMAGRFNFERDGAGSVRNAGLINITEGGYIVLAADDVGNAAGGRINAPKGSVVLASADRLTIDPRADGLVTFAVEGATLQRVARVDNAGVIQADGGQIALSARGTRELTGMVVNNTGALKADMIDERGGAIILSASSGSTQSTGSLQAMGSRGGGVQVTNDNGVAAVSGSIDVRGSTQGGSIVVAGNQTGLFAGTALDASGGVGGSVNIGGNFRGGAVGGVTSQQTYVAASASIRADGKTGKGGSVVVWADDATRFDGAISARGAGAGSGGDAEVSGRRALAFNGHADLGSASGQAGTLLLDPATITIKPGAAGTGALDTAFGAAPGATIAAATAGAGDNGISTGTLAAVAGSANILLEATGQITLADLSSEASTLDLKQVAGKSVTLRSTGTGGIQFANAADTIKTKGGDILIQAQGSGVIDIGNLSSGAGNISLSSSGAGAGAIRTGSLTTTGNVAYNAVNGAAGQRVGTVIKAAAVATTASVVDLGEKNEVGAYSGTVTGGSLNFKSIKDLTVGAVTLTGSAGATMDIRSDKKMTVTSGVTAVSGSASTAAIVRLAAEDDMSIGANVSAKGGGTFGQVAARVLITSDAGAVKQTAGQIKAWDVGPQQVDSAQLAHSAEVLIQAGKRAIDAKGPAGSSATVQTTDVFALSDGGRAQVTIDAPGGITSTGTISSRAATQPGITVNTEIANSGGTLQSSGNVNLTAAVLTVTQTAESNDPIKPDINLVKEGAGGIGIGGFDLNLGTLTSDSTTASGFAYYGIATSSGRHTTFNNTVRTNAQAGIVSASRNADSLVKTEGTALLDAPVLGLAGGRDAGIFKVKTKVGAFTVQGAKAVDMDNSAYSGVLTIVALGRISKETTNPQTNEVIPATNKPVGGVKIRSENINLLSLDNRSTNSYLFDGSRTDTTATPRQDLVLISNVLDYLPGTLATQDKTYAQLMPFTASRNVQVVHTALDVPVAGTTYYTGGPVGLLNQLHPKSTVMFGGAGYSGNIDIGLGTDTVARQIKLGAMELHFQTTGRVFNNYAVNRDSPAIWADSTGSAPFPVVQAALGCGLAAKPCLGDMTTGAIYIKDSLKQGAPAENRVRDVKITGTGAGTGGTAPVGAGATNDGGNGGGGGAVSAGGGGGANNGSLPGGSNAPPTGPSGGGNTNADPATTAAVDATNNPGQASVNPGGTPGAPPTDPGAGGAGAGQSDPGSTPLGTILAGGGEFSGDSGSDGPSGSDPAGGGTASGDPDTDPGAGDPAGGGVFSGDPGSDPGGNDPAGGGVMSGDAGTGPGATDPAGGGVLSGDPANPGGSGGSPDPSDPAGGGTISGLPPAGGPSGGEPAGSGVAGNDPAGGGTASGDPAGGGAVTPSNPSGSAGSGDVAGGDPLGGGALSGDAGAGGSTASATPAGPASGSTPGSNDGSAANDGSFAGGANAGGPTDGPGLAGGSNGGVFSDGSGAGPGQGTTPGSDAGSATSAFAGGSDAGNLAGSTGTGGMAPGGVFSDGAASGAGSGTGQPTGNTLGTADAGSLQGGGNPGASGSAPMADGAAGSAVGSGGTAGVGNPGGPGSTAGNASNAGEGQSNGFAGGASGGASGAADDRSQSVGGNAFADATTGREGSASANTVGAGSRTGNGQAGALQGEGQGRDGTGSTGTAQVSGRSASNASSTIGSPDGSAANQNSPGSSTASGPTVVMIDRSNAGHNALPCEDQIETVKSVSRAGQPYSDLLQLKGSGMRLRSDGDDALTQQPSCARKVSAK